MTLEQVEGEQSEVVQHRNEVEKNDHEQRSWWLIIVLLHLVAVLNNLYLWYRLQTYQCPLPPPC